MSPNLSWRLRSAIAMIALAVVAVAAGGPIRNSYSTACDPGNERLHVLTRDAGTRIHPPSALLTLQYDSPDNNPLGCSYPSVSKSHWGGDPKMMFDEAAAAFIAAGWESDGDSSRLPGKYDGNRFQIFQRSLAPGVLIYAGLRQGPAWVEVFVSSHTASYVNPYRGS